MRRKVDKVAKHHIAISVSKKIDSEFYRRPVFYDRKFPVLGDDPMVKYLRKFRHTDGAYKLWGRIFTVSRISAKVFNGNTKIIVDPTSRPRLNSDLLCLPWCFESANFDHRLIASFSGLMGGLDKFPGKWAAYDYIVESCLKQGVHAAPIYGVVLKDPTPNTLHYWLKKLWDNAENISEYESLLERHRIRVGVETGVDR